jgi:hypothetical protein
LRQESVAYIYDNWRLIFEDPPEALDALRRDGRSPADLSKEPQYSSEAGG